MKFACLLICMIFLSFMVDDMLFELLVRVMGMSTERGALLEELEDVDHA